MSYGPVTVRRKPEHSDARLVLDTTAHHEIQCGFKSGRPEPKRHAQGGRVCIEAAGGYDAVVGAVRHREFENFKAADLLRLLASDAVIADIKGMWRELTLPPEIKRWQL